MKWLRRRFWNWDTLVVVPVYPGWLALEMGRTLREVYVPSIQAELNRPCLLLKLAEGRR